VAFRLESKLLISAGIIASLSAIWHLLCIFGGPSWYAFARAPQAIIDSAQQGTYLAPVGTVIVAGLMFACTVFAFSASGLIRRVPLLRSALASIALLCILRALVAIPYLSTQVGIDIWEVIASSVWLYVGICFLFGLLKLCKTETETETET